jgi:hypothetical protein
MRGSRHRSCLPLLQLRHTNAASPVSCCLIKALRVSERTDTSPHVRLHFHYLASSCSCSFAFSNPNTTTQRDYHVNMDSNAETAAPETTVPETVVPEPPCQRYQIAPDFDLVIIAKELHPNTKGTERERVIYVHEFEVSKKVVCEIGYFSAVVSSEEFAVTGKDLYEVADTGTDLYEVKDDDPVALKIWLELLHHGKTTESLGVSIASVWHVLIVARKYDFDALGESAQAWFSEWYSHNTRNREFNTLQCREPIYPCYTFNHAQGFAAVTKKLAYNTPGHIQESRPKGISAEQEEQRLRSRAISK